MFFALSVASILFLFGIGYGLTAFLLPEGEDASPAEKFPFVLTTGLLANHLLILLTPSLTVSLYAGAMLAGCSAILFAIRRKGRLRPVRTGSLFPPAAAAFVLLLYYFTLLIDPLEDWDARSIWFFHARMIWSAGTAGMSAGWDHPAIRFSHVDYPILIPALAAQGSHLLGYWNEYAPKLSLFLVLIPPVCWVFTFFSRSLSFLFLLLVFPFGLKDFLLSGSMDGCVAFYAAVSMLLFGRYFQRGRPLDGMAGISCLAMAGNVKNEGLLIGLIGIFAVAAAGILSRRFRLADFKGFFRPGRIAWLAAILSPGVIWSVYYKSKWGLASDLQLGKAAALDRMIHRVWDGVSLPHILKATFFNQETTLWLAVAAFAVCLAALAVSRRRTLGWVPALATAVLYYGCIVLVFLLIPNDPTARAFSSMYRTMLTATGCMIVATYFVLKELEEAPASRRPAEPPSLTSA